MDGLNIWQSITGFKISAEKTKVIAFHRKRNVLLPKLKLNEKEITNATSIKFLGMIFDKKLTWIDHVKYLFDKCSKSLNLLKVLKSTRWGADRKTLMLFYRSYVRSILDYGCTAYSSASATILKLLDRIHHTGIRLVTGAFRTSPTGSLCVEAAEPPLEYRRHILMLKQTVKMKALPERECSQLSDENPLTHKYIPRKRFPTPFNIRSKILITDLNFRIPQIYLQSRLKIPPWQIPTININYKFYHYSRKNSIT